MRLIDTITLQFEDVQFEDHMRTWERYAILSHRWGDGEVSHQDYLDNKKHTGSGYAKIINFCRLAKQNGLNWAWVDTCCIDKKNSAELSKAINSMYRWYALSNQCYVYLADVPAASAMTGEGRQKAFRESQWWKRGWTLQELLAPPSVEFYDCEWAKLGTKDNLLDIIVDMTGIKVKHLCNFKPYDPVIVNLFAPSVAEIMSWMSDRSTLKPEDTAYCLMGFFNVNMPLLYGEGGQKALLGFSEYITHQLQYKPARAHCWNRLEIIKKSDDQSIFASRGYTPSYLLAANPSFFKGLEKVHRIWLDNPIFKRKAFSMTNRGLKIRAPMAEADDGHRLMLLNCCDGHCDNFSSPEAQDTSDEMAYKHRWLAVKLERIPNGQWKRASPELFHVNPRVFKLDPKQIFVIQGYL